MRQAIVISVFLHSLILSIPRKKTPVSKSIVIDLRKKNLPSLRTLGKSYGKKGIFTPKMPPIVKKGISGPKNNIQYEISSHGQIIPKSLGNSQINIKYLIPHGVDKLNPIEMKFYSFNKRVYNGYINQIMKHYNNLKIEKPYIDFQKIGHHELEAKVTYDNNGNIVKIILRKKKSNELIQRYFLDVLEDLSIPNPPKDFISEKEFSLFYSLHINSRG